LNAEVIAGFAISITTQEPRGFVKPSPTASSDKVLAIAIRGGAFMDCDSRSRLYQGIQVGHGSIMLKLTPEQHNKLIAAYAARRNEVARLTRVDASLQYALLSANARRPFMISDSNEDHVWFSLESHLGVRFGRLRGMSVPQ
jgi:hypothetical protein